MYVLLPNDIIDACLLIILSLIWTD